MGISMDKKYQTRDGRPVLLLTTTAPEPWPVVGIVGDNGYYPKAWGGDGQFYQDGCSHSYDLVEVSRAVSERYVNVYSDSMSNVAYESLNPANVARSRCRERIGVLKISLFSDGTVETELLPSEETKP